MPFDQDVDRSGIDAVFSAKLPLESELLGRRRIALKNLSGLGFCQHCTAVGFSARRVRAVASLSEHISDVVCVSSKKEVRWVDASWRVASMAHKQSFRDWSVGKFPTDTMGAALLDALPRQADPNLPIASVERTRKPQPAVIRATPLDLGPETILKRTAEVSRPHEVHFMDTERWQL